MDSLDDFITATETAPVTKVKTVTYLGDIINPRDALDDDISPETIAMIQEAYQSCIDDNKSETSTVTDEEFWNQAWVTAFDLFKRCKVFLNHAGRQGFIPANNRLWASDIVDRIDDFLDLYEISDEKGDK